MAHSSNVRGFIPPQNDAERFLMRHIEDMAKFVQKRNIPRYSEFLSDREQALAKAALSSAQNISYRFDGGFADAERKVLCIEPISETTYAPISLILCKVKSFANNAQPTHKDFLGSLMSLSFERACLGDIIITPKNDTAYIFVLHSVLPIVLDEIHEIGRASVSLQEISLIEFPAQEAIQRQLKTSTVSSLRLDAVLATIIPCSRTQAASYISAGNVEINHVPTTNTSATVYEQDIFTVRRKGRFKLVTLLGKSKKDRYIIEYFQY